MKKYMRNIIPAAAFSLFILVFLFLIGSKVYAQNLEETRREQREAMESTYIKAVKEELQANGFPNSGVNMTKMTNDEGEWEYTVVVYHRSFEWMDEQRREELGNELTEMGNGCLGKISLELLAR